MVQSFIKGTPVDFTQLTLSDVAVLLASSKYNYALVQFVDNNANYVGAESRIAVYNRQGGVPTQAIPLGNGFNAGVNDQIVFSKAELNAGVRLINATAGKDVIVNVQFYVGQS